MRTRTFLATLCLAPALAAAQVPPRPTPPGPQDPAGGTVAVPPRRPPNAPGSPGARLGTPPIPPAARAAAPVAPTTPRAVPGSASGPAATAAAGAEAPLTPVKAGTGCTPIQGRFLLAFSKAEIVDLLEQASRWTCRNFIYSEDVAKGKITLLSKSAVSADEAYAAFLAALTSNGIAVYPTGRYWKLVRTADAKKAPIPTYTAEGTQTPADEQPMTRVLRLKYADADQVRGIMGNFLSPQGADLQSIPPDLLIITDIGLNIRRIERLVETVDRAGSSEAIRLIQVKYATAKDIADKVNQVFVQGAGTPGKPGRRSIIGSPARPGAAAPPAPGAPAAAPSAVDVQVTKIIPDDRTNKLIILADERSFDRISELVQQLDVPTVGQGGINVIYLKNASAEDLATTLSNLAQGKSGKTSTPMGSPVMPGQPPQPRPPSASGGTVTAELFTGDVKITADKAQNALVVQASGADLAVILRLVEKLDRPRRQVFVEAVIMEVTLNGSTQFGVGAHGVVPVSTGAGTGFIPIGLSPGRISTLGTLSNIQSLIGLGGFLTGYSGPVSASLKDLGLNIPSLGVMVQALQTNSDVNVISTPHVLASDNEESEITVGQNVPFQQGVATNSNLAALANSNSTTANLSSLLTSSVIPVSRQPVELKLKIKPQISEGDNIRLLIDEQTEEIVSTDPQLGPTTAKRSVKTQIVARDQSTIVIGGLIQERNTRTVKKVPFLGSLPILGWLFRDTTTSKQKTNLLLFLTPYIIRDESDYRRIYEKKRREQQEFMEQFYGRRSEYEVGIDYSRKSGPFSRLHRDVREETSRPENGGTGGPGEKVIGPDAKGPALPATPGAGPVPLPAPATPATPAPVSPEGGVEPLEVQPELQPPAEAAPAAPATPAPPPQPTPEPGR